MSPRRPSIDTPSIAKRDFYTLLRVGVSLSVLGLILGGSLLVIGLMTHEAAIPLIAIGAAMIAQSLASIGIMRAMLTVVVMLPSNFESRCVEGREEDRDVESDSVAR